MNDLDIMFLYYVTIFWYDLQGIKVALPCEITTGVTFLELYISFILAFQTKAREISKVRNLKLNFVIMVSGIYYVMYI